MPIKLSDDFLRPYRTKRDCFPNLLARSVYLSKFSRSGENWTDTVTRVVEGNCDSDIEGRELFNLIWRMKSLPPGRGLWVGGVPGIPADARFNCWNTTLRSIEDWLWTAEMLMLGGGVGIVLSALDSMPIVQHGNGVLRIVCSRSHPDVREIFPDERNGGPVFLVEDSREGWIAVFREVLRCAYAGLSLTVDISRVRPRGALIKTFGGVACGPGPLVQLLRDTYRLIRAAAGRRLNSVECLDVTNFIGRCVKSGNVRRSALLVLGDPSDSAFRNAKKDWQAVQSHRHTSNNSLGFRFERDLEEFDWESLVEDNSEFGEPGVANLFLARKTDPKVTGTNPCGEQFLEDKEACNLGEVFPALSRNGTERAIRLMVRYCMRQRICQLLDSESNEVGTRNMRIGAALGGLSDFIWSPGKLRSWYQVARREADTYAAELGVNSPITVTTVKPSGTISLLNGSSPGIHAAFAPYYLRRIRLDSQSEMASALQHAGMVPEIDAYDSLGKTLVFAFPIASEAIVTVQNQTVLDQIRRQVDVQESWADNAVSSTISFSQDEKSELTDCLALYAPRLKSVSCLPRSHGYKQPPYEEITKKEYERLMMTIDHNHPLTQGADIEDLECEGGICPTR